MRRSRGGMSAVYMWEVNVEALIFSGSGKLGSEGSSFISSGGNEGDSG